MDSDNESVEYEEWLPKVLKRWDALIADPNRDAKKYTAFLRFAFKSYDIPATTYIRRMNNNNRPRSKYKHLMLHICYNGRTRSMEEMRERFREVREIVYAFDPIRCGVEYDTVIRYSNSQVWERDPYNGPTYFRDLMSVGKGVVPYMPSDIRKLIVGH
jgi:hypothetical protein